jgi:HSP20 family molecular chaperone IbpA
MAPEEKLAKRPEAEVTRREQGPEYYIPAVDISETENEVILKYDMPGVEKEQVEITAEKNTLTVIGNVSRESLGDVVYQETRIGNYRRQFTLPGDVDSDKITADMKDGLLKIKISKPEKAKPKRIEITSG